MHYTICDLFCSSPCHPCSPIFPSISLPFSFTCICMPVSHPLSSQLLIFIFPFSKHVLHIPIPLHTSIFPSFQSSFPSPFFSLHQFLPLSIPTPLMILFSLLLHESFEQIWRDGDGSFARDIILTRAPLLIHESSWCASIRIKESIPLLSPSHPCNDHSSIKGLLPYWYHRKARISCHRSLFLKTEQAGAKQPSLWAPAAYPMSIPSVIRDSAHSYTRLISSAAQKVPLRLWGHEMKF